MATTRFRRFSQKIKTRGTSLKKLDMFDYSKGFTSYIANDAVALDVLRKSVDARISTLGRWTTRKGMSFYSDAAGEASDDTETSTTGAGDASVSTTTWQACKFTTTTAGRLTKVELNMKSNTGVAPVIVKIYSDNSGAPGTLLATSSIDNSEFGASYAYEVARFTEAPQLATTTSYWIVAHIQTEGSGAYHWSTTTNATTSLQSTDSGSTWSSTSRDLNFRTYLSTDSASLGLFRAYKSNGTKETLLAHGTTLYKASDVDGSLTSIKTGLSSSATHYRFANINDEVFYVNGVDAPRKYNFSTDAAMTWGTNGGSTPPTASLIAAHQDFIFLNDTSDSTRLEFSDEDDYESSASTNFIYVPSPKSPEPITALVSLNGVLHIFTTASKHTLYGADKATFQLVESQAKKGTFTQESVAVTRNYMYFLADDGVYRSNGLEDELISAQITDIIEGMTNKDSAVLAVDKNRLKLFYRSSGSGYNDKCLVYNLDYGSWESEDTGQYVNKAVLFKGGSDDFEFVTASSVVGQIFQHDETSNNYTDAGRPLEFELRTAYIHSQTPNAKKVWKRWYPRFEKQSRTYNVTVSTDTNFADSPNETSLNVGASGTTWGGGAEWGDGSVYGSDIYDSDRIAIPGQSYYLQLRIKKVGANTPIEFLGNTLMFTEKRLR